MHDGRRVDHLNILEQQAYLSNIGSKFVMCRPLQGVNRKWWDDASHANFVERAEWTDTTDPRRPPNAQQSYYPSFLLPINSSKAALARSQ
jgi:hypothetical protein